MAPTLFRKTSSALSSFSTSWTVENANPEGVQKGVNTREGALVLHIGRREVGFGSILKGSSLLLWLRSLDFLSTFPSSLLFTLIHFNSLFSSAFFIFVLYSFLLSSLFFYYLIFLLFYCCFTQDDLE